VCARVKEDMVFRTGGCQRQNGDDDKCISTGSTAAAAAAERVALLFNKISAGSVGDSHVCVYTYYIRIKIYYIYMSVCVYTRVLFRR
jgi:hypothetical protein